MMVDQEQQTQPDDLTDESLLDSVDDPQVEDSGIAPEEGDAESLMAQLEKTLTERDEFKAALQRERADFVNFRKRIEREKADMRATYVASTIAKLLPVLDDFDRAMNAVSSEDKQQGLVEGFGLIHKKFNDLITQMGVVAIDPLGQPFDPNFHEAIGAEDTDEYESGMVSAVLQKGYMLDDRCIRVAMVRVAN